MNCVFARQCPNFEREIPSGVSRFYGDPYSRCENTDCILYREEEDNEE